MRVPVQTPRTGPLHNNETRQNRECIVVPSQPWQPFTVERPYHIAANNAPVANAATDARTPGT